MAGEDRGPVLLWNTFVFGSLAILLVALRLGFRGYRKRLDLSDYFILIALLCSIAQETLNVIAVIEYGYGKHAAGLPKSIRKSPVPKKLFFANQVIFKATYLFSKLSLCVVYTHLFKRADTLIIRITRYLVHLTTFTVACYYTAAIFVSIFQCSPVEKSYNAKTPGTCIQLDQFRFSGHAVNIITSVMVICIPLPALMKMKDRRPEIKQLLFLILLGFVHTGCALSRLILQFFPDPAAKTDPQWVNTIPNAISMVEMDVGIIAASLVVMRPCFQFVYNVLTGRDTADLLAATTRSGGGYGHGYSKSKFSNLNSSGTRASVAVGSGAGGAGGYGRRDRKISKVVDIEMESRLVGEDGASIGEGEGARESYARSSGGGTRTSAVVMVHYAEGGGDLGRRF